MGFFLLKFTLVWINEVQKYCKSNFKQFQWLQFFSKRSNNINGCSCNFCTIYLCFAISSKIAAYVFYSQWSLNYIANAIFLNLWGKRFPKNYLVTYCTDFLIYQQITKAIVSEYIYPFIVIARKETIMPINLELS